MAFFDFIVWFYAEFYFITVYYMTFHCIVSHCMVLYFIWSYCTVSHCYVPLLQRVGELPRSASSHFHDIQDDFGKMLLTIMIMMTKT